MTIISINYSSIWSSCSRNMPGRTSSSKESGRATASSLEPTNGCESGAVAKLQQNLHIPHLASDSNATLTPRYTPNYANINIFNKVKIDKVAKEDVQKEVLIDPFPSLLPKKLDDLPFTKELIGKQGRKEDAMSHYPDDGKRLPSYDYHQWNFRAESAGRRGLFCGTPQNHNWGAMAMTNPYFPNPHMVPAHAHSTTDYRMSQWAAASKLQNAHSHLKPPVALKAGDDPISDLQALVAQRQNDLVDLRLPGQASSKVEEPVQLTVNKSDSADKEITSTNDSADADVEESKSEPELSSPMRATNLSTSEGGSSKPSNEAADTAQELPEEDVKPEHRPPSEPAKSEEIDDSLNETSETSDVSVSKADVKTDVSSPLNSSTEKIEKAEAAQTEQETVMETSTLASSGVVTDLSSDPSSDLVSQSVNTPDESNSSKGDTSIGAENSTNIADCLPTVSSTSTDVKVVGKDSAKKKKPTKKRKRPSAIKPEPKKQKTVKPKSVVERRGPVLHISGSRESPISVSILNGPRNDDDDLSGQRNRIAPPAEAYRRSGRSRHGLFSSTLSARYDARTADPTWVCVFCKQGSHRHGLGDLFGPYVVVKEEAMEMCEFSGDEMDIVETQKRGGRTKKSIRANNLVDHFQKMAGKLKRPKQGEGSQTMSGLLALSDDEGESPRFEVWVHEVCAVWSPGVCMVDTRLLGLQEAVWHCKNEVCSKCGLSGANLGCIHRNCPNRSHYPCAEDAGWSLPEETFISTCQFHVQRT